ncbi:MAG TPA: hypothetical protein VE422_08115 [Terriglobia bacterium]|nr:hypothetical protein [Terriglobia bacterium]
MKMQNELLPRQSRRYCREGTVLLALVLMLLFSPAAIAGSFTVKTERGGSVVGLALEFKEDIAFTSKSLDSRELLVQFNRSIDPPSMDRVVSDLKDWIAWTSNGYDTLLIHAARDMKFSVSSRSRSQIVIVMWPIEPSKPAEDPNASQLQLVQSRLLVATGHSKQAADLLKRLLQTQEPRVAVLSELAAIDLAANRWRSAVDLYAKAISMQPRNEDLIEARRRIFQDRAPVSSFETNLKSIAHDRSELLSSLSGEWLLSIPTKGRMLVERTTELPSLSSVSKSRYRMEASIQHDFFNGSVLRGAVYQNQRQFGTGASYNLSDSLGSNRIEADYGKSFWDLPSSIDAYGVRDRAGYSRLQRLFPRLTAQFNAALSRYRMDSVAAARTYSIGGGLDYTLRLRYPIIEMQYIVDMEKRIDKQGDARFPLSSRNVHAIGIALSTPIGKKARLAGSGGFSIDRKGGKGPFTTVRLSRRLNDRLSLEAFAERRQNSVSTGQTVTTAGARIQIHPGARSPS